MRQPLGYNDEHCVYVPLRGTEYGFAIYLPQAALAPLAMPGVTESQPLRGCKSLWRFEDGDKPYHHWVPLITSVGY